MKAGKLYHQYCIDKKGVSLIISVAVMMLLSIMAVTFVQLATYEQAASNNYLAQVDARLTAYAGFDKAMAEIYKRLLYDHYLDWEGHSSGNARLAYRKENYIENAYRTADPSNYINYNDLAYASTILRTRAENIISLPVTNATFTTSNGHTASGLVGRPPSSASSNRIGRYDLNGNYYALKISPPSYGRLNVNSHISSNTHSNTILRRILTTLASQCGFNTTQASQIADLIRPASWVASQPTQKRFGSQDALRTALNSSGIGSAMNREKLLGNLCTDSWIDSKGCVALPNSDISKPDGYTYLERRAPVNVNYISDELLYALVANIKGSAVFYKNDATYSTTILAPGQSYRSENSLTHTPTKVAINFSSLGTSKISSIVSAIKNSSYLDQTDQSPRYRDRMSFNQALETLLSAGFFNGYGQPSWLNNDIWNQAWRDALKSNFCPNGSNGFFNLNRGAYRRVGKAQMYDFSLGTPAHTTELCFHDDVGAVTIESLAQITARGGQVIAATARVSAIVNFATLMTQRSQQEFDMVVSNVANPDPDVLTLPLFRVYDATTKQVPNPAPYAYGIEGQVVPVTIAPTASSGYGAAFIPDLQNGLGSIYINKPSTVHYDIAPDGLCLYFETKFERQCYADVCHQSYCHPQIFFYFGS